MAHPAPRILVFLLALYAAGCRCGPPVEHCDTSADCEDDGLFCTAPPVCAFTRGEPFCMHGGSPCAFGQVCDEGSRRCRTDTDSEIPDGGTSDAQVTCEERVPGTACIASSDCSLTSTCQTELFDDFTFGTVREDGSAGRPFPMRAFSGGYCAAGCDARRLNDECAPCASCVGDGLSGSVRLPLYYYGGSYEIDDGVCREHCTPSQTSTGCAREGYSCDIETGTCMDACIDDRQCQIVLEDYNGDGNPELVDRGELSPRYCDFVTGRCRTRGTPGAQIGDRCTMDSECPTDAVCHRWGGAEGLCTRYGCRAAGFECEAPAVCDVRNLGSHTSGCLLSCRVGVEDGTAAMRGSGGGNPDCGPGLACAWNGVSEPGEERAGSCFVGEYNDRTASNIGAPCLTSDECYSPFGYGVCLYAQYTDISSGFCSVQSCGTFESGGAVVDGLLPGVTIASPICDTARGEVCMNLGSQLDSPQTYCMKRCETAAECAPGYSCTELLGGGARFCWPWCFAPGDCRGTCDSPGGGECTAFDDFCYCSDRVPR